MICCCIYLWHHSGKVYEALSKSGCLVHPSQRTLRDYSLAVKAEVGFADGQLMMAANKIEEWEQLVVILLEEMYIQEDLEYEKHSTTLIGLKN